MPSWLLALALGPCAVPLTPTFATVDFARVLREGEAGVAARARLAKEQARWERETGFLLDTWSATLGAVEALSPKGPSPALAVAEREEVVARRALFARWDIQGAVFTALQARLLGPFEARVRATIAAIAEHNGYAIVIDTDVQGAAPDLTAQVLAAVDAPEPDLSAPRP